ncbi:MAG: transporter substrate-binding protein [Acidimicrobiaceae bacterium]|nr:transporter substrate-binding protein [Acidimicrobiaceae bacterium]
MERMTGQSGPQLSTRRRHGRFGTPALAMSALAIAGTVTVGLATGSGASQAHATSAATTSFPPNLKGKSIVFADGSPPQQSDTQLYLMTKILKSWGADARIVNETGDPAAVTVVLSGEANAAYISTGDVINSHLVTFGPAQPRLDYQFVTTSSIHNMSQLAGKTFGWSNPHGVEAEMYGVLLRKFHVNPNSVTTALAGSSSVREAALLVGKIQATFVSTAQWDTLKAHGGFRDMENMAQVAPQVADSLMAASPGWLAKNHSSAVAIDEAWLEAAKEFNTQKSKWIAGADVYAAGSATKADATAQYDVFKLNNTFPATSDAFSPAHARFNEVVAQSVGALVSEPPLSKWFIDGDWTDALKALNIK